MSNRPSPARPRSFVLSALVATGLLALACGPELPVNDPKDGDGNVSPTIGVSATTPNGARRGPVLLSFKLLGAVETITDVSLEHRNGSDWVPATTRWIERDGADVLVAWDSFAEVDRDTTVDVRLRATAGEESATGEAVVSLRNDPETDRLVVVGHRLAPVEGGGVSGTGTAVSAFTWRSGTSAGLHGTPRRITVGVGPSAFRAAPHGRATLVLEERSSTLSLLETPLDGATAGVTRREVPLPAWGHLADVQWSGDGRHFFVTTYADPTDTSRGAAIWRYEPSEDLSTIPEPSHFATLPGPPSRFAVDPVNGFLLAACGPGAFGNGLSKLILFGADGVEIDRIEEQLDFANDIAIHPQGGFALWASDFSSEQVRRFRLDHTGLEQIGETLTTVAEPNQIAFHPASERDRPVALIGNGSRSSVTPVVFEGDDVSVGPRLTGVPLAYELDIIQRGDHAGTVLAVAVTQVMRVDVTADGVATHEGVVVDFGEETENIAAGIAIQR